MINNREQYNAYHREYRKRPENLQKLRKYYSEKMVEYRKNNKNYNDTNIRYYKKHPERASAHMKIWRALKEKKIKKSPCVMCGDKNSLAHHPSYDRPLDVVWLCKPHHRQIHYGGLKTVSMA